MPAPALRFSMCGYSRHKTVLFKLQHCHHLEFYLRTVDGNVLNDEIAFQDTSNPGNLSDPLLDQLFMMKGCKLSCLEVLMKYYKADAKATRRIVARMEKAKAAGAKQSDDAEALQLNNFIFAALNEEDCLEVLDSLLKILSEVTPLLFDGMCLVDIHEGDAVL